MKNPSKQKRRTGFVPYKKQLNELGEVINGPTKEKPILPYEIPPPSEKTLALRKEEKDKKVAAFKDWEEISRENIKSQIIRDNERKLERELSPREKSKTKKVITVKVDYKKGKTYISKP